MTMVKRKIYLSFPAEKIKESIICDMYDRYRVRFNIRTATVTETSGLMAIELEGDEKKVTEAQDYFTQCGLTVEPIEMNVIAT